MPPPQERTIRVRILGRDYALRVHLDDEAFTRDLAHYVDQRMQTFKQAHPEQPEMTAAVISALAIAEDLFAALDAQEALQDRLEHALAGLDAQLAAALAAPTEPQD